VSKYSIILDLFKRQRGTFLVLALKGQRTVVKKIAYGEKTA